MTGLTIILPIYGLFDSADIFYSFHQSPSDDAPLFPQGFFFSSEHTGLEVSLTPQNQ